MMADGPGLRSGGETWGPVWPDNVEKTGVWSGSPIVAAEAEQVERTRRRPGHRPIRGFCALQGPRGEGRKSRPPESASPRGGP
jgi:hypothetical protein